MSSWRLIRGLFQRRRQAYLRVFRGDTEELHRDGELVLADLRKFCHATDSTYVPGDRDAILVNEGRRQVFNRILSYLHVTDAELYRAVEQIPETDDD